MINIIDEKQCCGCKACEEVCPVQCISVKEGTLGHLFPIVDKEKCIGCNKCEQVCPMNDLFMEQNYKQRVFAAFSKNKEIRNSGSSGGMFGTFSYFLLEQGYLIYGASFDNNLKLKCTVANNKTDLKSLMKSKYVQSDMSGKYDEIKTYLKEGKKILFVSTPCQVAALKKYLGKDYSNLIAIDFFCHGVPSQKLFDECIKYDEKRHSIKILKFEFRTKLKNGSTPHYFTIKYRKNNKVLEKSKLYFDSPFYAAFQKYICLRESCYECVFAQKERVSDITIADFHDINRYIREINRFEGCSTVIINTSKGEKLWERCKNQLNVWEFDLQKLIDDKICFQGGTKRPKQRDEFISDYNNCAFADFAKKWMNPKRYWKQRIYYALPKNIRNIIKKTYRGVKL